jgi:beta-aspartyl-peptidase (threonine type)
MRKQKYIFPLLLLISFNVYASNFGIVIHGGAGTLDKQLMTNTMKQRYIDGLQKALNNGYKILNHGGSAKRAVQIAIETLENNPLFNAGHGAAYDAKGEHVLEASIMDGYNSKAGAAIGLRHIQNPINLVSQILLEPSFILLSGTEAEDYGINHHFSLVSNHVFDTKHRYLAYMKWKKAVRTKNLKKLNDEQKYGTVGAVALDTSGHFAAGTSTGGLTGKNPGRVGDTPIIGAGTFANRTCAVSMTGRGEDFIRYSMASSICMRMRFEHSSLKNSGERAFKEFTKNGGKGGGIGIGKNGIYFMTFNTKGMYRAVKMSNGVNHVLIY